MIGAFTGSLIFIWMTRHANRFSETLQLVSILKDRLRTCLVDIRSSPAESGPSDIIEDCVKDIETLITQLKSFAKDADIKPNEGVKSS